MYTIEKKVEMYFCCLIKDFCENTEVAGKKIIKKASLLQH